jgi:precorrin-6B methylase 2
VSLEVLRATVARLNREATVLTALAAALRARLRSTSLAPAIAPTMAPAVVDVVNALGLRTAIETATPAELAPLLAEIRTFMLHNANLISDVVDAAEGPPRWSPKDVTLLQAAGDVSVGLAHAIERAIAPKLDGLMNRLAQPGGAFLDVGAGVASLSLQMARQWPQLRVLGLEPWTPALELGQRNVAAAGFAQRIELRQQTAQELQEVDAFDLAWIPGLFVSEAAFAPAVAQVHGALRPGGWLLLALARPGDEPLASAITRFRAAAFGGAARDPATVRDLLAATGFTEIVDIPGPASSVTQLMAARRGPPPR